MQRLLVRTPAVAREYEISIGRGLLSATGQLARKCLGAQSQRLAVISNKRAFSLYGTTLLKSLRAGGFSVSFHLIGDGETAKSLQTADHALRFLRKNRIERSDGVVALGGGVVGDLAGFAAAVYLRGVSLIQVPTTLLAQIDSSVGGKTGVNLATGKNMVGCFHQPRAVVVDIETLSTLPGPELVAGWCECVKQGAVSSRKLFKQTTGFLKKNQAAKLLISPELARLIASHCAFKASIVAADEREDVARRDRHSRRILNFGHTIAHALETVTNYRWFRHGEAVGWGMLVAGQLSKNLGLLAESELELLSQGVGLCGSLPPAGHLDVNALIAALAHDKKRTAGNIQWVLLERIGRPRIVDGKDIGLRILRQSMREALRGH